MSTSCGYDGAPCGSVCVDPYICPPSDDGSNGGNSGLLICPAQDDSFFATDLPAAANNIAQPQGTFSIGPGGESIYRLPIAVTPGRRSVQPDLAIVYNSNMRWGLLGVGTTLEGLSQIARCPLNMLDDGQVRSVQFDTQDAFCLDGLRLIPINQGGSEFRTQPDTFRKIVADMDTSQLTNGPMSFVVYNKDGTIEEYGGSDVATDPGLSRVMANGGVVAAWNLSKRRDRFGNFMTVTYNNVQTKEGDGNYTAYWSPDTISYTGHQAANANSPDMLPQRTVRFGYQSADVPVDRYVNGMHLFEPLLMNSIEVDGPTSMVRRYEITYDPVRTSSQTDPRDASLDSSIAPWTIPGRLLERVSLIQEYGPDGVVLAAPVAFGYRGLYDEDLISVYSGADAFTRHDTGLPRTVQEPDDQALAEPLLITTDFTGDGTDDIVKYTAHFGPDGSDVINEVRTASLPTITSAQANDNGGIPIPMQFNSTVISWQGRVLVAAWPLDYDQDGFMDLVVIPQQRALPQDAARHILVLRSNGSTLTGPVDTGIVVPDDAPPYFADVDGDGVKDLIQCDSTSWTARLWANGGHPYWGPAIHITALEQGNFPCTLADNEVQLGGYFINAQEIMNLFVLDTNGDGAAELILPKSSEASHIDDPLSVIGFDTKTQQFQPAVSTTNLTLRNMAANRMLDINGDGLTDIMSISPEAVSASTDIVDINVFLNSGNGNFSQVLTNPGDYNKPTFGQYSSSVVMDTDGDGRMELIAPSTSADNTVHLTSYSWGFNHGTTGGILISKSYGAVGVENIVYGSVRPLVASNSPANLVYWDSSSDTLQMDTNHFDPYVDMVTDFEDEPRTVQSPSSPSNVNPRFHVDYGPMLHAPGVEAHGSPNHGYLGDSGCTYPLLCVRSWRPVVTHYRAFAGADAAQDYDLSYRGARYDRSGRGWLGFDEVQLATTDSVETWQYDNTDFDTTKRYWKAGLPVSHSIEAVTGGLQETQQSGYAYTRETRSHSDTGIDTFFYMLTQKTDTRYAPSHFNSANPGGAQIAQTITTTSPHLDSSGHVDDGGNIGEITTATQGTGRSLETTFKYDQEDTDNWLVGLPTDVTIKGAESDAPTPLRTQMREVKTTYANGLPLVVTIAPGDAQQQLTSLIFRDPFGNITNVSTTGQEAGASVTRQTCATYGDPETMFPTVVGNGANLFTRTKFDPNFGNPLQQVDPNGLLSLFGYDEFGRLAKVQRPSGGHRTIVRGLEENLDQVTRVEELLMTVDAVDSNGTSEHLHYNYGGRVVTRQTNRVGGGTNEEKRVYDGRGRMTGSVLSTSDTTSVHEFTYDGFGRLTQHLHPVLLVKTIEYDGLTTLITDARGQVTLVQSDAAGRTVTVQDPSINPQDPVGVTTYTYGPFDELLTVTDPVAGHTFSQTPSPFGLITGTVDPDRGTRTYEYSAFGQLTHESGGTITRDYTYDAIGRPKQLVEPEGTTVWTWDQGSNAKGQLTKITGPRCDTSLAYTYDSFSRLHTVTTSSSELTADVTYDYDDENGHDRLSQITFPSSAMDQSASEPFVVSYGYDAAGHVTSASSGGNLIWQWMAGDDQNRVQSDQFGNNVIQRTRTYTHSNDERLSSIQTTAGTAVLQSSSFSYDANDNLVSRVDNGGWTWQNATGTPHDEQFCYDALNRLTDVDLDGEPCSGTELHVGYYADGNIKSKSDVGVYAYDPVHVHGVQSVGAGTNYEYDDRGNQTTTPDLNITSYSARDLPLSVQNGGQLTDLAYDGLGNRIIKTSSTDGSSGDAKTTTFYASDLYTRVTDTSANQTTHRYYVPTPAGRVAVVIRVRDSSSGAPIGTDAVQYLLTDHLGSIDVVADSTGNTVERRSYDAFGKRRSPFGSPPMSIGQADPLLEGYAGHEEDGEFGLVNMGGRIYNPTLGRFLNADPITPHSFVSQSWNRYSYVMNNPLSLIDPSGFDDDEPDVVYSRIDENGNLWAYTSDSWTSPDGTINVNIFPVLVGNYGLAGASSSADNWNGHSAASGFSLPVGLYQLNGGAFRGYQMQVNGYTSIVGGVAATGAALGIVGGAMALAPEGFGALAAEGAEAAGAEGPTVETSQIPAKELMKELNQLAKASGERTPAKVLEDFFAENGLRARNAIPSGPPTVTPGVTADLLHIYREIALDAIEAEVDESGLQAARVELIDSVLGSGLVQ